MRVKLLLLFFLLGIFFELFKSQDCTDDSQCTSPSDPICQNEIGVCLENICYYTEVINCCSEITNCDIPSLPCIEGMECISNQCQPIYKECLNGQPCDGNDFCHDNDETCEKRYCVESSDQCQIEPLECIKPTNACMIVECIESIGGGCREYENDCYDGKGCTSDECDDVIGCVHELIPNCTECYGLGCITEDLCNPSRCIVLEYEFGNSNLRGDGPGTECRIEPVVCDSDDPCLENGRCFEGECLYDNICLSSQVVTTIATTASTTASTVSGTISQTLTSQSTTTEQITTFGTCSTGENSEEYKGPTYPNCLNCDDLNCYKMGKSCKYLKSWNDNCVNKIKDHHHNGNHGDNNRHKQSYVGVGGYGNVNQNDFEKYPKKLSKNECCPYTPSCI